MSSAKPSSICQKSKTLADSETLGAVIPALVIIDMQNYYLKRDSSYCRYFNTLEPGCLDYILHRCERTVVPNIQKLLLHFRKQRLPVMFLRLCGADPERNDLHIFFQETYRKGKQAGFDDLYPLASDGYAAVIDTIQPLPSEHVVDKTTFSPFTYTNFDNMLKKKGISTLVLGGLATSQCVESTARDASDRGYHIIHIEDAQADYDPASHSSSLYSSQGVCGGFVISTDEYFRLELRDIFTGTP
jgi:nicotinamidase-related amidase